MRVNIVYPKDNWILEKIAKKVLQIPDIPVSGDQLPDPSADINYYINWKLFKGPKTKCDMVWFTHFEKKDTTEILDKADFIIAKSKHGALKLKERGIDKCKIKILPGIGPQAGIRPRKIRLGISGRPYPGTKRKGEDQLIELSSDLDKNIFQFVFENESWLPVMAKMQGDSRILGGLEFWEYIDYWLSTARAEGGPMDIINAYYALIPVISRRIGFFYSMKTCEDFAYSQYDEMLGYLRKLEQNKKDKLKEIKDYTWDNFRKWHKKVFKEIYESMG